MLLTPAILALLCCSALAGAVAVVAAAGGLSAAAGWDADDSGPRQLAREHRALLVEATLRVVLGFQLVSLVVFVVTLDRLHPLFAGAMCATGTLNASRFGYPALAVQVAVALLCGLWLVTNRATTGAGGTALARFQHVFAAIVTGALVAGSLLQARFFADLDPGIVTSCCATTFGAAAGGLVAGVAALPPAAGRAAFFAVLALTLGAGLRALAGRRTVLYALLALALGLVSAAAVVTWVAPAYYGLPHHHCPFCLLSRELGYVGYPLYLFLAIAVVTGVGSGLVSSLRAFDPLRTLRPAAERRLCKVSMIAFGLFSLLAVWPLVAAGLRLPT